MGPAIGLWDAPNTAGFHQEATVGAGERKHTEAHVVAHISGSRAEAVTELERRARSHSPEHPRSPRRRRLLRDGDGFLPVVDGAWQSFVTRFTVAELLEDSAAPVAPEPVEALSDHDPAKIIPGQQGPLPISPAPDPAATRLLHIEEPGSRSGGS